FRGRRRRRRASTRAGRAPSQPPRPAPRRGRTRRSPPTRGRAPDRGLPPGYHGSAGARPARPGARISPGRRPAIALDAPSGAADDASTMRIGRLSYVATQAYLVALSLGAVGAAIWIVRFFGARGGYGEALSRASENAS